MKKIFSILISLSIFFISVNLCHSATTSDGLITLDFFEDTQSGIENRWILDFTVNDVGGGIESFFFTMEMFNVLMDFNNTYNPESVFYEFGYMSSGTIPIFLTSKISSKTGTNPVPTGTMFTFFALPNPNLNNLPDQGELFLDDFSARLTYVDNLGQQKDEFVPLHGPVGFVVPEPFSMLLYLFGGFFLSLLAKLKAK